MRLKLIFIILSILFTLTINAQYSDNQSKTAGFSGTNFDKVSVGVRLTPAVSWVNINHDDAQADGASLNYGLGAVVEYKFSYLLSVVSGINYHTFGGYALDNASLNDFTNKDNFKLSYSEIEIPLGFKLQTPTLADKSYYIIGGLSTGFIMSANERHISNLAKTEPSNNNILPITTLSRLGGFIGLGSNYRVGRRITVFGEIVYKTAITSVADSKNYSNDGLHNYSQDIEILPSSMDFSIGLMF